MPTSSYHGPQNNHRLVNNKAYLEKCTTNAYSSRNDFVINLKHCSKCNKFEFLQFFIESHKIYSNRLLAKM